MKPIYSLIIMFFISFSFLQAQEEQVEEKVNENGRLESSFYQVKGSHSFNVGVGFPNLASSAFKIADLAGFNNEGSATPSFTLKYEYAFSENIGAGMHIGYYSAKTPTAVGDILSNPTDIIDNITGVGCSLGLDIPGFPCDTTFVNETIEGEEAYDRVHATTIAGRFTYHRKMLDKLDTYASVLLGYSIINRKRIGDPNADLERFKAPTFVYFTSAGIRYYLTPKIAFYGEIGYGALTLANVGLTYRIMPKNYGQ